LCVCVSATHLDQSSPCPRELPYSPAGGGQPDTDTPPSVWQRMSPLTSPSRHAILPLPPASALIRLCSSSLTPPAMPAPAR
jgi:hypothetical protein